jgi:deoxyribonuclease-4
VTDRATLDAAVGELDARVGLDRLRCLHVNDAASDLGSNLDRHASIGEGRMGSKLGVFLAHPAFQGLPAILETPGPDGHGPDTAEVARLRALHRSGRRSLARASR